MEHSDVRAKAIAHYCLHNTREAYAMEKAKAEGEKKSPTGGFAPPPNWAQFRQGGGVA